MNKKIVAELIQDEFENINLTVELNKILNNEEYRNNMINEYKKLREDLGGVGASKKSAEIIVECLLKNKC